MFNISRSIVAGFQNLFCFVLVIITIIFRTQCYETSYHTVVQLGVFHNNTTLGKSTYRENRGGRATEMKTSVSKVAPINLCAITAEVAKDTVQLDSAQCDQDLFAFKRTKQHPPPPYSQFKARLIMNLCTVSNYLSTLQLSRSFATI